MSAPLPESPPPLPMSSPGQRGLPGFLVFVLLALLIGLLFALEIFAGGPTRVFGFERPFTTSRQVFEREIEIDDALRELPTWTARVLAPALGTQGSARNDAIGAWAEMEQAYLALPAELQKAPQDERARLSACRLVLLAEANRLHEGRSRLEELRAAGYTSFAEALNRAFSGTRSDDTRAFEQYDLAILGDGYLRESLELRLANAIGDEPRVERLSTARALRAEHWRDVAVRLFGTYLALIGAGLIVFLAWVARNRPASVSSTAVSPPPWTLDEGFRVALIAAFSGAFVLILLSWLDRTVSIPVFAGFTTLLASIPMLVLLQKKLLAPHGLSFVNAFGLAPLGNPLSWILVILALLAIDELGSRAIETGLAAAGLHTHWTETPVEAFLTNDRWRVFGTSFDVIAWAPLFEEIGCRGLLYLTLRRAYGPTRAAILSAVLFSAVHMGSVPSFASAAWSGTVWAIAFERTKSLVPGIVCHAIGNAYVVVTMHTFYR